MALEQDLRHGLLEEGKSNQEMSVASLREKEISHWDKGRAHLKAYDHHRTRAREYIKLGDNSKRRGEQWRVLRYSQKAGLHATAQQLHGDAAKKHHRAADNYLLHQTDEYRKRNSPLRKAEDAHIASKIANEASKKAHEATEATK